MNLGSDRRWRGFGEMVERLKKQTMGVEERCAGEGGRAGVTVVSPVLPYSSYCAQGAKE